MPISRHGHAVTPPRRWPRARASSRCSRRSVRRLDIRDRACSIGCSGSDGVRRSREQPARSVPNTKCSPQSSGLTSQQVLARSACHDIAGGDAGSRSLACCSVERWVLGEPADLVGGRLICAAVHDALAWAKASAAVKAVALVARCRGRRPAARGRPDARKMLRQGDRKTGK